MRNKPLSNDEFIKRACLKHGYKYDYSESKYINAKTKVKIICHTHGVFEQCPDKHINAGYGCRKCGYANGWKQVDRKVTTETFIQRAKAKHGDRFGYEKTEYVDSKTKVTITCKLHGDISIIAANHLWGSSCLKCGTTYTTEEFIEKSISVHGKDRYDYSKVNYEHGRKKVIIICNKHGEFLQRAGNHLSGKGCPKCNMSKGEVAIENFLANNNVDFEREKTFDTCRNKGKLRFDFFIQKWNLLIEYDGIQHLKKTNYWNEKFDRLKIRLENDRIKNLWAKDNGYALIRISYRFRKTIAKKLKSELISRGFVF